MCDVPDGCKERLGIPVRCHFGSRGIAAVDDVLLTVFSVLDMSSELGLSLVSRSGVNEGVLADVVVFVGVNGVLLTAGGFDISGITVTMRLLEEDLEELLPMMWDLSSLGLFEGQ